VPIHCRVRLCRVTRLPPPHSTLFPYTTLFRSPEETFASWDTVPEGFTQVIAADSLIPRDSASLLLVSRAASRSRLRSLSVSGEEVLRRVLPNTPVKDTPRSPSSSAFFLHSSLMFGKLVMVDCQVPRMVASWTFRVRVSSVS